METKTCEEDFVAHVDILSAGFESGKLPVDTVKAVNSEIPFVEKPLAVVVVDPWSTGTRLCEEITSRGHKVIVVWEGQNVRSECLGASEVLMHSEDVEETVRNLGVLNEVYEITAIVPGSETGVLLAESLANAMEFPSNPPQSAQARRNKFMMQEALRKHSLRAIKQIITNDLSEAQTFITDPAHSSLFLEPFQVILKPNMGAGSDDVYLCTSMEDFTEKFNLINGKCNSLGLTNDGVLVQEFLDGDEYVIDTVSINGMHKVAAIWKYDKRSVNGRFNVYYGSFALANDTPETQDMINYVFKVLDSLQVVNGPAHAEVKLTRTGPCLVEVGSRLHGGGGTWLEMAQRCWKTNQISALLDSVITEDFSSQPDEQKREPPTEFPKTLHEHGVVVDLVSFEDGIVEEMVGEQILRDLKSFSSMSLFVKEGDVVTKTVDCNTTPGQLILIHESKEQLLEDYNFVHTLSQTPGGLYKLKSS